MIKRQKDLKEENEVLEIEKSKNKNELILRKCFERKGDAGEPRSQPNFKENK
jgi:hypothetical protein